MDAILPVVMEALSTIHDVPNLSHQFGTKTLVTRGGYSEVYRAKWNRSGTQAPVNPEVCYKVLRPPMSSMPPIVEQVRKTMKHLKREMKIWKDLDHGNIVRFIGFAIEDRGGVPEAVLVSEWCANGNLAEYLHCEPSCNRLALLLDVARGLTYLHDRDPVVVHGDLKPFNVLISDAGHAKLCDFGFSLIADGLTTGFTSSAPGFTLRYCAPEVLESGKKTRPGDTYSFACTCAMILFSKNPFPLLTNDTQLWRALESGLSPWNWEQSSPVEKILSSCCVGLPDARPVMREVFLWLVDACVEPDSSPILEVSDPEANRPLALPPTDSSVNPFLMPDGDPASSNAVTPSKETTTKVDEQAVPVALSPEAHNTIPMQKQAKLLLPKATPGPREVKELTVEPPSNTAQQSSQARNHIHRDQHGDSAGSRLGPPGTTRTSRFPSPGPSDLKRQVSPELVTALPRSRLERERQERLRAEEELRRKEAEARRKLAEKDVELDRLEAAPADALTQTAIAATVAATAPKKPSANDSDEQGRNITSYDDEGGGSSEDEEDPTTDEHVRIPYRPKKLMHARKRNRKVHFVTSHTTAGGMSTPPSSFSVLAPAEEGQRRRDEAIRDRLATLERLEQREKAEREAQEREGAATLKSVRQNASIAREQPSVSDITARIRNSLEQAQPAAPQMSHPSLPILPVRLDRGPPENSPFVRPQASLSSEASGQTVWENVRRIEQDPSKPPKPHSHSVHSMTTHTTAGGTSTPLSSFSVLAPAEEAQRRRGEAIRDRLATLERLKQREKAEREAQERERAATLKSVRQNLSIAREQPSLSDITARIRNSSEQAQPAPRIPHPSLPILPVRLDRGPPENSPFMHPQANHPSEASGQTVWENVRRIEQDPSKLPKPNPHSVDSVTTHTTAGGMSTPLSSFSVLAPAEEGQRRRNEAIRDRLATLERLEQREGAEREAQERGRAATLKSVNQNRSIAREQPSVSDIIRNSSEQAQPAASRMLHPSLQILPVRLDTAPKPSTNDSNEQGRNVTSYDGEGGGSSVDEEDSTTDEHVRIPYRPKKLMRARKRNRKGSMDSVTTHTTAGGMSTPLSSFSVLAPAEEAQRRRDEAIRDRLATLERLEQREKAEREAQEREWAATVKRNFSITRDQPSASDITAPL